MVFGVIREIKMTSDWLRCIIVILSQHREGVREIGRLVVYLSRQHGRSQDFSKGGSHCVKQRVLAFSQPEYCRLFE